MSVAVSTLLRKVKVAAVKLQLPDTIQWVDAELSGYSDPVPSYRMISGRSMARDHYIGWQPIVAPTQILDGLRKRALGQSVSALEHLLADDNNNLMLPYPPNVVSALRQFNSDLSEAALFISKPHIAAIVDKVRNLVLDWSLDLEKAGITGDGLSFSAREKSVAASSHINIQIDGSNARLNIGSEDNSFNLT